MWNPRLQELGLSSYCLQMWARTHTLCSWEPQRCTLWPRGWWRVGGSAILKHNLSSLLKAWRETPPLLSHAEPWSIPLSGCKSFNLVEEAGTLLQLQQPSNELCHNSPPQLLPSWRPRDSKQWNLIQRGVRLCEQQREKKSKQKTSSGVENLVKNWGLELDDF